MKKQQIIGAIIALIAMVSIFFLPIVNIGGYEISLFDGFEEVPAYSISWLVFPVLCIIANLIGKLRGLTAWLMLIPFLYGLVYFAIPESSPGLGVWVYGVLTLVLIVYTIKTKKA